MPIKTDYPYLCDLEITYINEILLIDKIYPHSLSPTYRGIALR